MAVLLCFYVNKYPGATNVHPASCGKCVLLGSNSAVPPFLARVEMDVKKGILINNYCFPLLSYTLATQTCTRSHVKNSLPGQHGRSTGEGCRECKEERITQSNFCFTSTSPTAELPSRKPPGPLLLPPLPLSCPHLRGKGVRTSG